MPRDRSSLLVALVATVAIVQTLLVPVLVSHDHGPEGHVEQISIADTACAGGVTAHLHAAHHVTMPECPACSIVQQPIPLGSTSAELVPRLAVDQLDKAFASASSSAYPSRSTRAPPIG